ncbi:LysR family transcriptional regulator [Synoicihabitans lomoniglobus]|uniref:LysR substrate-binding domain-containing protein n=1 Tax=Synoicihabitans lomoniglobus TaxID=2909285 RepID=A0AAE9ZVN8_9BACT|nr:LysR substrate-binding domain-containing protein [Opitutaceae bacterium LMO-M01]WED63308.1 LysR substrate-binding domain-containing protein [Opitutaceae bacterium LMO-M01]
MELRHLRYFVAVAEELNFRRAAERVRVAQPALSKQIKDLEHDVGAKLLARNTAGVALTDAGAVFLPEAQEILAHAERATVMAREAHSGWRGSLTVANVSAISASFMPAALSTFHARYPEVDVSLEEMLFPEQISALETGKIQVGFSIESGTPLPDQFERFKVLETEICVAMGENHAMANRSRVSLHDLEGERLLCFDPGTHPMHRDLIRRICTDRGVKPGRFKGVSSIESIHAMIEGDQGISFLAAASARRRRTEGVVYRPIKERGDDLRLELYAIWKRQDVSPLALNFVEVLRVVCGQKATTGTAAA